MKLRFAPSPTGYLHVGNARTLLLNWMYAKKHGAEFILRFDDTDQERSKDEYVLQIEADLAWLGLDYVAVFKQSERLDLYNKAIEALKESGRLYPCYETKQELDFKRKRQLSQGKPPIYDRAALKLSAGEIASYKAEGRIAHWRFKLEDKVIKWNDIGHGEISFEGKHLSDPILIRENGAPVFTLSGVVDDIDMGITHVIRGDDHISNTAIQIQIIEALGGKCEDFTFAHLPLITGAKGEGLSKRLGSLSLMDLHSHNYEAMALVNYLGNLGNSKETLIAKTNAEFVKMFNLSNFGKSSPKYFQEDLDRANSKLLQEFSYDEIKPRLDELRIKQVDAQLWEAVKGNLNKLVDLKLYEDICFNAITPKIEDAEFIDIAKGHLPATPWSEETWAAWANAVKEETGRKGKALFMPLRQALTGQDHGPEMKKLLPIIGHEKALKRLSGEKA